ncbi:hypothetical protein HHI36_021346 [Cryptolaemus montrouzieri]|uniref:Uncharacterized protein n=1 Tax=Cryptolaemus montrouzieri TaxID=559131 RepID=A0ABD2MWZ2_9CUCU
MRRNLENKYLQPATLPSYCEKPIFDPQFMATLQDPQIQQARAISFDNSASQQIMENLKKKKQNQNSQTKFPKLMSNPFPEPIKTTFTPHTISDKEKAQQILDDRKMEQMMLSDTQVRNYSTACKQENNSIRASKKFYDTSSLSGSRSLKNNSNFYDTRKFASEPLNKSRILDESFSMIGGVNTKAIVRERSHKINHRNFSNNSECCVDSNKCPQNKSCIPRKCNKIKLKGCPPPRDNTICKRKNKEVHCQKVEAPYPSYSESCYMEPKPQNSECELCSWTPKKHPHFKGKVIVPPKQYHTQTNDHTATQPENFGKYSPGSWKNQSQLWVQLASLSQIPPKISDTSSYNHNKKIKTNLFTGENCGNVEKDTSKCKKISPGSCKGARLPKPIDYIKSYIESRKGKKNDACTPQGKKECLQEFPIENNNLIANLQNTDKRDDFGTNKAILSDLLYNSKVFEIACCKKGERIIPDYPRGCDKPYEDKSRTCPTGLTLKKSKKDRLKKKKPKSCN